MLHTHGTWAWGQIGRRRDAGRCGQHLPRRTAEHMAPSMDGGQCVQQREERPHRVANTSLSRTPHGMRQRRVQLAQRTAPLHDTMRCVVDTPDAAVHMHEQDVDGPHTALWQGQRRCGCGNQGVQDPHNLCRCEALHRLHKGMKRVFLLLLDASEHRLHTQGHRRRWRGIHGHVTQCAEGFRGVYIRAPNKREQREYCFGCLMLTLMGAGTPLSPPPPADTCEAIPAAVFLFVAGRRWKQEKKTACTHHGNACAASPSSRRPWRGRPCRAYVVITQPTTTGHSSSGSRRSSSKHTAH